MSFLPLAQAYFLLTQTLTRQGWLDPENSGIDSYLWILFLIHGRTDFYLAEISFHPMACHLHNCYPLNPANSTHYMYLVNMSSLSQDQLQ